MNNTDKYPSNDNDHETKTVTKVHDQGDSWCVEMSGSGFNFPKVEGASPRVGSSVRFYPAGLGYTIRGVFVDGALVFYRTAEEEKARHTQWVADEKQKRRVEAEKNAPAVDARVAKLPGPFQERIRLFRERNPDFRAEYEPYEIFCLEQATIILLKLKSPEAIKEFSSSMSYEKQRRAVPELDDGHSGNTFAFSVRMAHMLASDPLVHLVPEMHGSLCPLVGCKDFGCLAADNGG